MLHLRDVSYRYPNQQDPLFSHVSFSLYPGDKVALLGHNGAGKSTLLALVSGHKTPDEGEVDRPGRCFYLDQDDQLGGDSTVRDALLAGFPDHYARCGQLEVMENAGLPDPIAYAALITTFTETGGFDLLTRLTITLGSFGFSESTLDRPVASLSGGERRLLRLATAFLDTPDLIVLDEPTNHLDARGTDYLINAVRGSSLPFLIVSHDRHFLDETVTRVLELTRGSLTAYSGNYSTFLASKEADHRQRVKKTERLESEIGKLQEIERSYKIWGARKEKEKSGAADKGFIGARAARLMKRGILAKERITTRIDDLKEAKPWLDKHYQLYFEPVPTPSGTCLVVSDLHYRVADTRLFAGLSLTLEWGEKLTLTGPNGAGKSTLIRLLLGELTPNEGRILWGKPLTVGYLPQRWDSAQDVRVTASLFAKAQHHRARLLMGCINIRGDAFHQPLGALSEGQRRKVRLVRLILDAPNVLVLDEPTTHLDYESVELLEAALLDYQGTLILVSHDRYLRGRVTTREVALEVL